MAAQNQANYIGILTANGEAPRKGPRVVPLNLDFSLKAAYDINLASMQENDRIEFVQGVWVDNSLGAFSISCLNRRTGQKITWPAGAYGWAAVFCPNQPNLVFTGLLADGSAVIPVILTSFPVANCIVQASGSTQGGSSGMDASANAAILQANVLSTVAANGSRAFIEVQNQSANQLQVVLDDGIGGVPSIILLAAGTGINTPGADWTSNTFKGRLRVFSASPLDQVMVHWD